METPFQAIGRMQESQARGWFHEDWEIDYGALREQSDRNERTRAIWTAFDKGAQFVRQRILGLRAARA